MFSGVDPTDIHGVGELKSVLGKRAETERRGPKREAREGGVRPLEVEWAMTRERSREST